MQKKQYTNTKIFDVCTVMSNRQTVHIEKNFPMSSGPRCQRRWFGSMGPRTQRIDCEKHWVMRGCVGGNIMGDIPGYTLWTNTTMENKYTQCVNSLYIECKHEKCCFNFLGYTTNYSGYVPGYNAEIVRDQNENVWYGVFYEGVTGVAIVRH